MPRAPGGIDKKLDAWKCTKEEINEMIALKLAKTKSDNQLRMLAERIIEMVAPKLVKAQRRDYDLTTARKE